MPPKIGSLKLG